MKNTRLLLKHNKCYFLLSILYNQGIIKSYSNYDPQDLVYSPESTIYIG